MGIFDLFKRKGHHSATLIFNDKKKTAIMIVENEVIIKRLNLKFIGDKMIAKEGKLIVIRSIPETRTISRIHAKLSRQSDGKYAITDFSSYGTFVNNEKVEKGVPTLLNDGDKISLGGLGEDCGIEFEVVYS